LHFIVRQDFSLVTDSRFLNLLFYKHIKFFTNMQLCDRVFRLYNRNARKLLINNLYNIKTNNNLSI